MATFPRVKRVRIVCRAHPWLMEVTNDNGVTVGDVCDKVNFQTFTYTISLNIDINPASFIRSTNGIWVDRSGTQR